MVADHLAEDERLLPSVYLEQAGRLRCHAQRGYWQVFDGMPPWAGVIGRTFSTGEPTVVVDVAAAPDYLEAIPGVRGEVCVPVRAAGRTAGVINVESRQPLAERVLEEAKACARLLGQRLDALGGHSTVSPAQRLARHAAKLAAMVQAEEIEAAVVAAARDVSGMDSAMVATTGPAGAPVPGRTAGPLGAVLRGMDSAGLGRMYSWVRAGTSCYTVGSAEGAGFADADFLREAGAGTLVLLPLPGVGEHLGMLAMASRATVVIDTEMVELLELLAAQAGSSLQTAAAVAELRERAARDPLTGLGHHASFHDALQRARADLGSTEAAAVLLIDVDGFKSINDTHGHAAGDQVLRDMARVLSAALRDGDELFRIGGDEFAALARVTSAGEALELGRRLSAAASRDGGTTISVGVALPVDGEPEAGLLARADAALYSVKRGGRNAVELAPAAQAARTGPGEARAA